MNTPEWNEERILRMIDDGVEESLHLDYKGAGSLAKTTQKKEEIVKDVTAFANSDGGVIIYGVRENSAADKKHRPIGIDPINRAEYSKEWLEQVISNASPRMPDIRIHPVPISKDDTKCLYVVEIPKGETAYQTTDGRYYRRHNFESTFMRDHEVRDVMNRIKVPSFKVEAYLGMRDPWEKSNLTFRVTNVSSRIALHYALSVRMPLKLCGNLVDPKGDNAVLESDQYGHYYGFSLGNEKFRAPLFPKATAILEQEICCNVQRFSILTGEEIIIRPSIDVIVYADEMEPANISFDPKSIQGKWSLGSSPGLVPVR